MSRTGIAIASWAQKITKAWRPVVEAVFEVGRLLAESKEALEHGEWTLMVEQKLPFGVRTAQRLMAIAADERIVTIAKKTPEKLPAEWTTLYEVSRLGDEQLQLGIEKGLIGPDASRNDVRQITLAAKREERQKPVEGGGTVEDLRALIDKGMVFNRIAADPPWPYDTWSDKGATRSAVQHYKTMTVEEIMALPVKQLAAKDAILHLWVISTQLDPALDVIYEWGFSYKKLGFLWIKEDQSGQPKMGNGQWTRDEAEVCLLATRGEPKRDDAGVRQVIRAPVGEHSAKPEEFRERVDRLSSGPVLELFGRRPRENWWVWGNQIKWEPPHA